MNLTKINNLNENGEALLGSLARGNVLLRFICLIKINNVNNIDDITCNNILIEI